MTDQLLQATGLKDALSLIIWLLLALNFVVALAIALWGWRKFHKLPRVVKLFLAVSMAIGVAYGMGLWTPEGAVKAWEELRDKAVDLYMRFDGYTRTHRWIGIVFLALLVPLVGTRGIREG